MANEDLSYEDFASLPDYKILKCNIKTLRAQQDKRKFSLYNIVVGFRASLAEIKDETLRKQFIVAFAELRGKRNKELVLKDYSNLAALFSAGMRRAHQ